MSWKRRVKGTIKQIGKPFKLSERRVHLEDISIGKGGVQRTMFVPAKYEYLSEIISLENPDKARGSIRELWREFNDAKSRDKRVRIWRATNLAVQRAKAIQNRTNLSEREQKEFREIEGIYQNAAKRMRSQL